MNQLCFVCAVNTKGQIGTNREIVFIYLFMRF